MKKGGQFTLFVILGVVLLVVIGVFYLYRSEIFSLAGLEELALPSEVSEIEDHVQDCLEASAEEAVSNVAYYGGYYTLPATSYYDEDLESNVVYYLYNGTDVMVSEEEVENSLNENIEFFVSGCIDLTKFLEFEIVEGERVISSSLGNNTVEVIMENPLVVTVGDNVYTLDDSYETSVNANLGWLYSIAKKIVEFDADSEDIDYTLLGSYGLSSIVVAPVNQDTILYILKDETSFNGEAPLIFMFAEYYPGLEAVECLEDIDCSEGTCVEGVCEEVKE